MKTNGGTPEFFRIQIQERLDESWSDWLDGLEISHPEDGTTLISGEFPDQSALIGVLLKIHHMGLKLVCVKRNTR